MLYCHIYNNYTVAVNGNGNFSSQQCKTNTYNLNIWIKYNLYEVKLYAFVVASNYKINKLKNAHSAAGPSAVGVPDIAVGLVHPPLSVEVFYGGQLRPDDVLSSLH